MSAEVGVGGSRRVCCSSVGRCCQAFNIVQPVVGCLLLCPLTVQLHSCCPPNAPAHPGPVLCSLGDIDEARSLFRRCTEAAPSCT